jgi:iron complex outermembrane receptor protein
MRGRPASAAARGLVALCAALAAVTAPSHAQDERPRTPAVLDEIIVTATRVETNLQETPMSVHAFSGGDLDLSGIDTGRELGIMVPNVVLNPGRVNDVGGTSMLVRGLPGVGTYVDGVSFDGVGFLQRSFIELERVEVLRGPQGTLFGRNSNGGAVSIVTRPPAEEFGARLDVELGEYSGRTFALSADVPLSPYFKTKFTALSDENDGFLESQTAPFAGGDYDNSLLRADFLWEPNADFSLRFNVNEENQHGSVARIIRISNPQTLHVLAYNVLAGNPDHLAQARAINPAFPNPPFALPNDRFTPETHEAGYAGGSLGEWQTMSDMPEASIVDQQYAVLTLDWAITEQLFLRSISAYVDRDVEAIFSTDGSEFDAITGAGRGSLQAASQELHLIGTHFNGRLDSLLGLYYQHREFWDRGYEWWHWEFAIPNAGLSPPAQNQPAVNYVRQWGATTGNAGLATYGPLTFLARDILVSGTDTDRAFFGQLSIGLLEKLDLTLGFRFTGEDDSFAQYLPADAFRPAEPGAVPAGDPYAVAAVLFAQDRADFGTISTPRVAISHRPTDDIFLYASYAEGYTSGAILTVAVLPDPIVLDPEVVTTRELGLRSDLLDNRLRLNATYFDSLWDGLRVPKAVAIPSGGMTFVPSSDGVASTTGLEVELFYSAGERWELDFSLGILDSEYLEIGVPPANGTGLQPGIPLAYAPDWSYSFGVRHRWPLAQGGSLLFVGNYGWMDEYQRVPNNDNQTKNPDGSDKPEPAYGVLNARMIYEPAGGNWQVSVFGTNLTNEWYVNGGFDGTFFASWDFGTIGRPREVGVGLRFVFD